MIKVRVRVSVGVMPSVDEPKFLRVSGDQTVDAVVHGVKKYSKFGGEQEVKILMGCLRGIWSDT